MEIRNGDDLKRYLERIAEEANKEVGKFVAQDVKDSIKTNVYDVYSPKDYDRTYSLANSVDVIGSHTLNGVNTTTVGHDVRQLSYTSLNSTLSDKEAVPNMIITGSIGAIHEKGYWRDSSRMQPNHTFAFPRDYITPVKIGLISTYPSMFKSVVRSQTGAKVI